jgi:hypothetical protein
MSDILRQWEAYINEKPTRDIRNTCARLQALYQKANENKKNKHLNDLFPSKDDHKTFEEYLPKYEAKINNDEEINLPIRYPKLTNDTGDFYAQFMHSNISIMKKRPYESSENSNDGTEQTNHEEHRLLFHLGPSPKRTLISRQNLIKTKSPVI